MNSTFSITLRNYRCFDWRHPAKIEISPGFTAIIGLNNSGKSTVLKAIYELRNVFGSFSHLTNGATHCETTTSFPGIADMTELANENDRSGFELTIETTLDDFDSYSAAYVTEKVTLGIDTNSGKVFLKSMVCVNGDWQRKSVERSQITSMRAEGGNRLSLDGVGVVDLRAIAGRCSELLEARYYPAFRNAINEGGGKYYDLAIGTSLVQQWDQWKAGNFKAKKMAMIDVQKNIASLLGFSSLSIQADADNKNIELIIDDKPYRLNEVGAGIAQLIIVFASALAEQPSYIFIDEPELNLHPALQLGFLTMLGSYARQGIVYATHSIGLARSSAEKMYVVTKTENHSEIHPYNGKAPGLSECLGELSYSARSELGCEGILLVEGPTDVLCFQEFLRKIGKDKKYVVIQLGGSAMIRAGRVDQIRELDRLVSPENIKVFIDSEKNCDDEEIEDQRKSFINECKQAKINVVVSQRRATENYFTDRAITKALGDQYRALELFQNLNKANPGWKKALNWKIAREITFDELKDSDLGQFLESL